MPNVFQQFLNNLKGEDPALPSKESDDFRSIVAAASFKIGRDYLQFPKVVVLPVTARGVGVPGMSERPWSRLHADIFFAGNAPIMYSLSIYREPPDTMQSNLRATAYFDGRLNCWRWRRKQGADPRWQRRSPIQPWMLPN